MFYRKYLIRAQNKLEKIQSIPIKVRHKTTKDAARGRNKISTE
jgi:hypothetical protein